MGAQTIDAKTFQRLFLAAAKRIDSQKEYINELNVFPVPDGDTGSNMSMTIMSAAREVGKIADPTMKNVCKAISNGSLRGARGNSGVILSQLFRGFTRVVAKTEELTVSDLCAGFDRAVETAYKAVMKPKEGTILTVAKGISQKADELAQTEIELVPFCEQVVAHGYEVLEQTPELLPVLKEAGVVDSGGQGLMEVLQGALDALTGKTTELFVPEGVTPGSAPKPDSFVHKPISTDDIKYGYCTEFIILLDQPMSPGQEKDFKDYLLSIGDSLVCVADDEICKIHVHTNHPGQAFERGLTYGQLSNMKIDNMRIEHQEKLFKDAEHMAALQREAEAKQEAAAKKEQEELKESGFIVVSVGDGFSEIFRGLGVDAVIEGGQTMNPSTEDILNAIDAVKARNVFVMPNNKNIILAAEQARDLTDDKNVIVLPTRSIPQGIAAMIGYMAENTVEENISAMSESIKDIKSGEVTYAVRDTVIEGREIHAGDYMGIGDDGIAAVEKQLDETVLNLVRTMVDEDSELVTLYYGAEVGKAEASELAKKLGETFEECDIEVDAGGQPIYYYVLSVE